MKIDYLNELKELDILLIKNMFFTKKTEPKVKRTASPLQLKICKYLKDNRKSNISQSDLERELNISRATISTTLATMEERGTIERVTSEKDARVKYVRLTESSLKGFKEMQKRLDELNDKIVRGIPKDDLANFLNVLTKMKANLELPSERSRK